MPSRKEVVPLTNEQRGLAERYLWLANEWVGKFSKSMPAEDCKQIARFAVCVAAQDYDGSTGSTFETHARQKIRYLSLDSAKRATMINISRPKGKRDEAKVERAYAVARLYDQNPKTLIDYPDKEANESSLWAKPVDLGEAIDRLEWHEKFHRLLARLPERSRTAVEMRLAGARDIEIGHAIGLCRAGASKVAQMALKAIGSQMGMSIQNRRGRTTSLVVRGN